MCFIQSFKKINEKEKNNYRSFKYTQPNVITQFFSVISYLIKHWGGICVYITTPMCEMNEKRRRKITETE